MVTIKRNSFWTLEEAQRWIGNSEHIITYKEPESILDRGWYEVSVIWRHC